MSVGIFEEEAVIGKIFEKLKLASDIKACTLVNKRWNRVHGCAKTSIILHDWQMLESGRLFERFPNLTSIDLGPTWSNSSDPDVLGQSAVYLSRGSCYMKLDPDFGNPFSVSRPLHEQSVLPDSFDDALQSLVEFYPNLRRLGLVDVYRVSKEHRRLTRSQQGECQQLLENSEYYVRPAFRPTTVRAGRTAAEVQKSSHTQIDYSEEYLERDAEGVEILGDCQTLQELEVRQCTDETIKALSRCRNLLVAKLVGNVPGLYHATFTDRGLRLFSKGCSKILELSLSHGHVGFDGLAAIAEGCPMLSTLCLSGKSFKPGWMRALRLFETLHTLQLENFSDPWNPPDATGGVVTDDKTTTSIKKLVFLHHDMKLPVLFTSLLTVCPHLEELDIRNCRALASASFLSISKCTSMKRLNLEGCNMITAAHLQTILLELKDIEHLEVTDCERVKDKEIKQPLADIMFGLKELKWQPTTDHIARAGLITKGRWLLGQPLPAQLGLSKDTER